MDRYGWKDKICSVMSTSQSVILPRIGITMQVNVEACPYLHYQIRRSKSTRSNTVWPSGGSAQWQIFIGGANRRSIHGEKAAWAGNSIAKEGPFNCAELRCRKGRGYVICQADIYHPQIRTFPTPQKKHLPGGQLPPPFFFFFFLAHFSRLFRLTAHGGYQGWEGGGA